MAEKNEIVIIDSSFLVAINYQPDLTYERAERLVNKLSPSTLLILPCEVFSETINTIWRKIAKIRAQEVAYDVISSEVYTFEQTTPEIYNTALRKFEKQKKDVSFTDCIVMAFADSFKTKKILGFDEAFNKNGYTV